MSQTVNVHAAKTHLSALLEQVERGQEVIIARNGKPVARLVPEKPPERRPGRFKGCSQIPDGAFFDPLSVEDLALWEASAVPELSGREANAAKASRHGSSRRRPAAASKRHGL
jgi:prevent-host-death family protein